AEGDCNAKLGITILHEVVVINSCVLPNKTLNVSVQVELRLERELLSPYYVVLAIILYV
ncbi:hypothetical protein PanWU01x14_095500, partial [Parasponia andersonii]